jgi:hypothetical protein
VLYTARLALVRAQEANLTARYGQRPLVVPMIPVRWPDGTPHETGLAKLREIVQRRLTEASTDIEQTFSNVAQVEQLCRASGGHLRTLMTLMQSTCAEARAAHAELPLTAVDVTAAIHNLGAQRRIIAANYAEALRQVSTTHRLDDLPPDVRYAVLHHRLVYEYFSGRDYWYDTSTLLHTEEAGNGT